MEGKEPPHFLKLFDGAMVIHSGKYVSFYCSLPMLKKLLVKALSEYNEVYFKTICADFLNELEFFINDKKNSVYSTISLTGYTVKK